MNFRGDQIGIMFRVQAVFGKRTVLKRPKSVKRLQKTNLSNQNNDLIKPLNFDETDVEWHQ